MNKSRLLLIVVCFVSLNFISCGENENVEIKKDNGKDPMEDFEGWIKRQVESLLKIDAVEKYTLTIHEEYLDRDTLIDAVILVNREEYAKKNKITAVFASEIMIYQDKAIDITDKILAMLNKKR